MARFGIHREAITGRRMGILVLSRSDMHDRTLDVPYIVVSITDADRPDAVVASSDYLMDVLRVRFHDIDTQTADRTLMTPDDARRIVDFVRRYLDAAAAIVCHCGAGISRSAGVAAALSRWLNGDDAPFFEHYVPNMHAYRLVLDAAMASEQHSDESRRPPHASRS